MPRSFRPKRCGNGKVKQRSLLFNLSCCFLISLITPSFRVPMMVSRSSPRRVFAPFTHLHGCLLSTVRRSQVMCFAGTCSAGFVTPCAPNCACVELINHCSTGTWMSRRSLQCTHYKPPLSHLKPYRSTSNVNLQSFTSTIDIYFLLLFASISYYSQLTESAVVYLLDPLSLHPFISLPL
ncbi:hypothetical protein HDV63DRAFT_200747 [Trichoderma sp. SZMC 28014]